MRTTLMVLMLAGLAGAAVAQTPSPSPANAHSVRPKVLGVFDENSGDPVEGVRVTDILTGTFATTTKTGTVALNFIASGGSLVRVQKVGYSVQTMFVAVTPADTAPITVVFKHVTELPAVVTKADSSAHFISPLLNGFEERRRAGNGGYFLSEPELRKLDNNILGNVVRRFPSVSITEERGSTSFLMPTLRCAVGGKAGPPSVFLNGIEVPPDVSPNTPHSLGNNPAGYAIDLNAFHISDLAGVEFYPDNTGAPIGFAHSSLRCGALYLWTRER